MKLTSLLLIILAPTFQIWLSVLKFKGRVKIQMSIIAVLAFLIGIASSLIAAWLITTVALSDYQTARCGISSFAIFIAGLSITLIATPVITLVFYITGKFRQRNITPDIKPF